jgi:thiamine biosynthesis lipoprotein
MVMIMAVTCIGCETTADTKEELQRFQKEYLTLFDTVTQLIGYADTEKVFETQAQLIYDELEVYHKLYDIYENYEGINNIKTINDNAGIAPVVVDRKIIDLLLLGKELYEETDGKINIAFGSVLSIWHTYRTEGLEHPEAATIPTEEELTEAANHTDITKVIIDEAASTVYLEDENMSLDVGSIGKGYAVEKAAQAAKEAGVTSMLFSVGGNIRAIGVKGNGESWKVGIQNPYEDVEGSYLKKVAARNVSLVTSGDYQRYYEVEGKRYHHIISPDTLFPAENFRAVSILCEDSGRADGLSTAVFNMTYEEGLAFIEGLSGVEAMWMLSDETIYYSSGFEKNLVE